MPRSVRNSTMSVFLRPTLAAGVALLAGLSSAAVPALPARQAAQPSGVPAAACLQDAAHAARALCLHRLLSRRAPVEPAGAAPATPDGGGEQAS